jgi:DNA-binding response OmpR family regulator
MKYRIRLVEDSLAACLDGAGFAYETIPKISLDNAETYLNSFTDQHPLVLVVNASRINSETNNILQCSRRLIERGSKIAVLGVFDRQALQSVRANELQKVNQCEIDDFLILPILPIEVKLRLNRLVQQAFGRAESIGKSLQCGPLKFELESLHTLVNGIKVELTRRESELLRFLCQKPFLIVTRQQIATQVWKIPRATASFDSVLNGHLSRLRCKLSAAGCNDFLKSIPRQGISVNPPISTL